MKKLMLMIFGVLLAGGVLLAQARGPRPNGGPPPMFGGPSPDQVLTQYLGLSAEQQAQWKSIHEASRASMEALMEQRHTLEEQLHTALDNPNADAATVGRIMLDIRALNEKMKAAHDAIDAQLAATLTAEQKTKFAAFQAARAFLQQHDGPPPPPR